MTKPISPTCLIMRDEAEALEAIRKASTMYGREQEEIMEAAKLVEQRRLNINLARIADALDRLSSKKAAGG